MINAVTHRDYLHKGLNVNVEIYDDRMEIYNFGGLPKGLSKKTFGTKSVLRNKLIASLMQRIGEPQTSKTIKRGLKFLKDKELTLIEGSTRTTKYKVTEKYKKLKKKL